MTAFQSIIEQKLLQINEVYYWLLFYKTHKYYNLLTKIIKTEFIYKNGPFANLEGLGEKTCWSN